MSLLQEYQDERARTEHWIQKYFEEIGVDRQTMLLRAELSNRWKDFKHAVKNILDRKLIETTKPGQRFRTYDLRPKWLARLGRKT
jgi:argonaute-like protein implicated in RNA metabolism and viral defense